MLSVAAVTVTAGLAAAVPGGQANPQAAVLQDFRERVDAYVALRKQIQKDTPPQRETRDPAEIQAAQAALADGLRTARRDARQGDIFTPEIRSAFRRLMYPELRGEDRPRTKAALRDDAPVPAKVPLDINAEYPEEEPLPTMPPDILRNLPKLPEGLEYRIVGRDLILRDAEANLIVDYIPNAIR